MNKSRINLLRQWAKKSIYSYDELKYYYKQFYMAGNKIEFKKKLKEGSLEGYVKKEKK